MTIIIIIIMIVISVSPVNVKNQLAKLSSREIEEPTEKGYESTLFSTRSSDSRKSQKKFKRKRKKLRNRSTTTTLTPVPVTPPLLTTTETPWQTTPVQWRLVAERLFGPPWQQDLQGPEKPTSPRILPSMRDLIEQNKANSGAKSFGSKRKPVTDNVGDFGNQKLVRFGNFGSRQGHREFPNSYERSAGIFLSSNFGFGFKFITVLSRRSSRILN